MNDLISRMAIALNPIVAVLIIAAGGVAGGHFANSPVGIAIGAITGLALALPLCGGIGLLASIEDQGRVPVSSIRASTEPTLNTNANGQGAMTDSNNTTTPASTTQASGEAAAPDAAEAPYNEVEAGHLQTGKFDLYHLSKAKRMLEAGNFREAINQAGACLAHAPRNAEAREIRKIARSKR